MSNMTLQDSFLNYLQVLFPNNTVISISGKAGTGKTSLSLLLIGASLTVSDPYERNAVWIQASESFPKKRLYSLFRRNNEQLQYLANHIFVAPGSGPCTDYKTQYDLLIRVSKSESLFPPKTQFIIIDNISHHLRYRISLLDDIEQKSSLLNKFYDNILCPLIFRCQREKIILVLIHEVTFDIKTQQTRPFFSHLYERIKGIHISLTNDLFSGLRTLHLTFNRKTISIPFTLTDMGFEVLKNS